MKIIFLNGPPGCGKDTAGRLLSRHGAVSCFKLIWPAEVLFRQAFCIGVEDWIRWRERDKNEEVELFGGKSLRRAFIEFSEDYMKPKFGQDIFGRLLVRRLQQSEPFTKVAVITDSGFAAEATPAIEWAGPENCILVRLTRNGCTFEGDSRSYWEPEVPIESLILGNNDSIEAFRGDLDYVLEPILGEN